MPYKRNYKLATKRYVHNAINAELEKKIHDTDNRTVQITNDPNPYQLAEISEITVGDSFIAQRTGNQIKLTSVQVRGYVNFPTGDDETIPPFCYCRVIVFQWFANEATDPPQGTDIIFSYGAANTAQDMSFYSKNPSHKFKILKDKIFLVSPIIPIKHFHWMFTNIDKNITYHNAYPITGDIFMIVISDIDETDTEVPDLNFSCRTTYTDA